MTTSSTAARRKGFGPEFETIQEILKDFGLSDSENMVFATLLRIGSRQASTVAKRTGVSRAHVYDILDRLVRRGLVSVHEKDGVRHFTALSLEELILALEHKEAALAARREQLQEITLALEQPGLNLWSDPLTKSYRGVEARTRIMQELSRKEAEGVLLFCCASSSLLFENLAPTPESLSHLIHSVPSSFTVVLFSDDSSSTELARKIENPAVVSFAGKLPAEMVVSGNRLTFIGTRSGVSCCITVEQPALASNLRILCSSLIGTQKPLKNH